MFDREHLQASLSAIGAAMQPGLFEALEAAYRARGRHYHSDKHVAECLAHLETMRQHAQRPDEIAVALWFHDAVYNPRRDDNEARSAQWAKDYLTEAGADAATVQRIYDMILATQHHQSEDPDTALLIDIDLGILGAPPAAFERYEQGIRREYRWVPGPLYRSARRRVLRGFLERPYIYATAPMREQLEVQARENLSRKLAEL